MIFEQNRLFGIIPVSKAKEVPPDTKVILKSKDYPDMPLIREVLRSIHVHQDNRVTYRTQIKGSLAAFQNKTPEEVNTMRIKSGGIIIQRVFRYRPDRKAAKA